METKKFLSNGEEVLIVRELDDGYLYQQIYYSNGYDDCYEYVDEITYFGTKDKFFDNPPEVKLHKTIINLNAEIERLQKEKEKIEQLKSQEKQLLTEIKNRDFLQCLVDYFNENFKYVVSLNRKIEIFHKDRISLSNYIQINNYEDEGWNFRILSNHSYASEYDKIIRVFESFNEAQQFAKQRLIKNLKSGTEKSDYPWSSKRIKDWHDDIDSSLKLSNDEDIIKLYEEKYQEAKTREDIKKKEQLEKEIKEKQEKLQQLWH